MGVYKGELYDYIYDDIRGKLVFDIGSNIGQMTKKFVNVNAKVIAVEPQIKLTHHENYKGVFAIKHMCVSNEVAEKKIFYECARHSASSLYKSWKERHPTKKWTETTVATTTLDALIEEFGKPKYIKIDVEGNESKVLEGLSHKIDLISFEFMIGVTDYAINCVDIIEKKFGFKKLMPFIKKKIKNEKGKVIKLHAYFNEYETKEELKNYLDGDFPKITKQANRNIGDILVVL